MLERALCQGVASGSSGVCRLGKKEAANHLSEPQAPLLSAGRCPDLWEDKRQSILALLPNSAA